MSSSHPLILRLPFWLVDDGFHLERLLSFEEQSWAKTRPLVEAFGLSAPEKKFARKLLQHRRNHWLFRCNQRAFCGDFVWIDMSSPRPGKRPAAVIELKMNEELRLDAGGVQLQNADKAIEEIADTSGVIRVDGPSQCICGDASEVFAWLAEKGK